MKRKYHGKHAHGDLARHPDPTYRGSAFSALHGPPLVFSFAEAVRYIHKRRYRRGATHPPHAAREYEIVEVPHG